MRVLFLGDIVGKPGYSAVLQHAGRLRSELGLDALVVNAENASDGSGLMPRQYQRLIDAGVDAITMGDHLYKCRDIIPSLQADDARIVKPANYPESAAGKDWVVVDIAGTPLAIVSIMGRVFMRPVDCPLDAMDRVLSEIDEFRDSNNKPVRNIIVDVHAEATSDKQMMGRYLDGRVSGVFGTHTHVPTADTCVLPGGTAFQCDVGMCGPYASIIGRDIDRVTKTTRTFEPRHFHVATKDVRLCGAIFETDKEGLAISADRFEESID